ncbi:MAG: winged helix-turn-helix transcriptional regulator [Theionarchaea archaeon]|nr:winged helix-turn-helix transcriptional regulator [Theionarchaea archaeon]
MYDMHARMLKALGDVTRLRILELLRNGELCVCEIIPQIEASQSNISQHLRILNDAGIIELEKRGRENHYSIVNEKVFAILDLINEVILENLKTKIAELES